MHDFRGDARAARSRSAPSRHSASRGDRGDGGCRRSISSASTGSTRRSAANASRIWCGPPTSIACRPSCGCPATGRRPLPPRSTAARAACWCRASRRRSKPGCGQGDALSAGRRARRRARARGGLRLSHSGLSGAANEELLLAIQVETAEGLANIDAIAAIDGVDVIFVGPGDLSVSIDAMGPAGAGRLSPAIETIGAAIAQAGSPASSARPPISAAGPASRFFILASDTMFLGASVAAACDTARKALQDGADRRTHPPPGHRSGRNFLSLKLWP